MGVLGDTMNEFKQAKTPEKVFIVGGAVAVVAVMLYVHNQSTGTGSPAQGATGASLTGGGTGGGAGGIQTVPTSSGGSVPILPPGLQPIFDSLGNLLGYEPVSTPTTGTTNSGSASGTGTVQPKAFNPHAPQLPQGLKIPAQLGALFTYNGTTYTVVPGSGGIIYGAVGKMSPQQAQNTPIGPGKYVISAPASHYTNIKQGGGPYGTRVLSTRGARIAPTREGKRQYTQATKVMALRNR